MKRKSIATQFLALIASISVCAFADKADVNNVTIQATGHNNYRLDVTVLHADSGWEHYANRWDVMDEQGNLLGSRVLAHPHETEQPFTRSLTLEIPPSVKIITIRANDLVHKLGGKELSVKVPSP